MAAFDPTDLRLRVQAGMSGPELRRLLTGWGATPDELAASDASTLAHHVVRVGAKRFGPAELIRRLSVEKPLVEWPELPEAEERWAGPVSLPGLTPPPAAAAASEDTVVDRPLPPRPADEVEHAEADAPSASTPASTGSSAPSASNGGPASARGELFYLTPPAQDGARRGVDPRLVIAGLAGLSLLVVLAFVAGLLWRRPPETPAPLASTSADAADPVPAARRPGLAGRAADVIDQRLLQVAEACALSVNGVPTREVFELAQEACGRDEVEKRRRAREREAALGLRSYDADTTPRAPLPLPVDDEPPPPPRRPDRGPAPTKPTKAEPPSCKQACGRVRSECAEACGPEPTDASQYDRYQSCNGRCIVRETRCRGSCF